ncbi:helix-turn-helix domain-containing protein [Brevibacterium sediminis]|uniref:helix-turn-helix domain-containing protein n=1 Tax=Brevibacterium TaxID=1696 RepID=UPI001557B022|nr:MULTISPECIES: helix-turn-helix transcriptional regulator [Brevibacterium]MCS4594589.1 helix-turn-helix domain-containing protein [Brevibacterium sediminis]
MTDKPASSPEWAEFARQLGINLRRARAAIDLTQEETAAIAGISLYAYQQYERGRTMSGQGSATNPRLATILAISQSLRTNLQDLLPESPDLTVR